MLTHDIAAWVFNIKVTSCSTHNLMLMKVLERYWYAICSNMLHWNLTKFILQYSMCLQDGCILFIWTYRISYGQQLRQASNKPYVPYKVRRGNSDKNFKLLGPLPPTNGQYPWCLCCRIQLLSTFQHDLTIIAKRAVRSSRRWKWSHHSKICWWGNSDNCIQSTRLVGYSTMVRAYEDCKDGICQFIPCALCKNVSEATSVVCFLWFQQSCKFLACFARLALSRNLADHEEDKQVSDHGRCSAWPRANLSYATAKVRLPPLVFEK